MREYQSNSMTDYIANKQTGKSCKHALKETLIKEQHYEQDDNKNQTIHCYRGADKSFARPGRKQANIYVRMTWISFGALPCRGEKKKLDDSSRLDVVEIARVPDILPGFFPSWSG